MKLAMIKIQIEEKRFLSMTRTARAQGRARPRYLQCRPKNSKILYEKFEI